MRFSNKEFKELAKAWAAITLAFTILLTRGRVDAASALIISGVTVGAGFLLHELAHKLTAQYYNCWAEFRSDDKMLVFAVLSAFLGFIFAAPGAVYIRGRISVRQNGIISAAGPLTNIALAILFYLSVPFTGAIGGYGAMINSFLALFNMIPIMNLDGAKVLRWNKAMFGVLIGISFLSYLFVTGL